MRDRKVIMSVDGQDGEVMPVTAGLPQGPTTSPFLFAIYIAGAHGAVGGQAEYSRSISFVGDVA